MHKKSIFLAGAGAVVLILLLRFVGSSDVFSVLAGTDKVLLFSAIAFQFLMMLSWNLKWKFLFRYLKIKISYFKLFPILLVGNLGDSISPGARLGGEPLRLYYLKKKGIKTKDSLTTILLERAYNLVAFMLLSIFSIAVTLVFVPMPLWLSIILVVAFAFAFFLSSLIFYAFYNEEKGLSVVRKLVDKLLPRVYKLKSFKIKGRKQSYSEVKRNVNRSVKHFFDEVIQVSKAKNLWGYGLFLSFLYFFHIYFQAYIIFRAVGADIPFYLVVAFITIADLVGLLVLIPSGVGVVELLLVVFVKSVGVPLAPAVTAVLIIRAIYYFFALGAGYSSMLWLERK